MPWKLDIIMFVRFHANTAVTGYKMLYAHLKALNFFCSFPMLTWNLIQDQFAAEINDEKFIKTELFPVVKTAQFLSGFMIEASKLGSKYPAYCLTIILRERLSPEEFKQLQHEWSLNDTKNFGNLYNLYIHACCKDQVPFLNEVLHLFVQNSNAYKAVFPSIRNAINKSRKTEKVLPNYAGGFPTVETNYYFGEAAAQWVHTACKQYGVYSGHGPNNHDGPHFSVPPFSGGGCITAATGVLVLDGNDVKEVPIAETKEGQTVLTARGAAERTAELVVTHGNRFLYSFNEDKPFMSLEHTIMTQRGWASLDPQSSMEYTPHQEVHKLSVGDVVWKLKDTSITNLSSSKKLEYDMIKVNRINIEKLDPTCPLFDLHLRGGHHSYFTNGYLCLVDYPEITMQRLASNYSSMSVFEQHKMQKLLKENKGLLNKALGANLGEHISHAVGNAPVVAPAHHTKANGTVKHKSPTVQVKNIVAEFTLKHVKGNNPCIDECAPC